MTNAFCASVNLDAFIVLRSVPTQGTNGKAQTRFEGVFGGRLRLYGHLDVEGFVQTQPSGFRLCRKGGFNPHLAKIGFLD